MADKLKVIVAALLVVIGIAAFYLLGDKPGYMRVGALLAAGVVAVVVFYQSAAGKATWEFVKGARQETRKVVWPSNKETMQVTFVVFVMAVLVAVFLKIVDWGLSKILIFTRG